MKMPHPPNGNASAWITFLSRTVQLVFLPLLAFIMLWILSIDRDVTEIKANRYTSADALASQTEYGRQVSALWQELAALRVEIALLPPQEFKDKVMSIEFRLRQAELNQAAFHPVSQGAEE